MSDTHHRCRPTISMRSGCRSRPTGPTRRSLGCSPAREGMHYYTPDGREIIDGTAGLWCVNAGHGRREITEAIQRQAAVMDFAPTFQMGHPIAFQAAAKLADFLPDRARPRVLHQLRLGERRHRAQDRARLSSGARRSRAGAADRARARLSRRRLRRHVGGRHRAEPAPVRCAAAVRRSSAAHARSRAQRLHARPAGTGARISPTRLEGLVALHGAETIAAVMVEPVAGSTGVLIPPLGYLERLRAICDRHGILLIFDEVITGFGRLGTPFGAERLGVTPDIVTMAKGLTNAAVPMGAVAVKDDIYQAIVDGAPARDRAVPRLHLFRAPARLRRRHRHRSNCSGATISPVARAPWRPIGRSARTACAACPTLSTSATSASSAGSSWRRAPDQPTDRASRVFQRCFDARRADPHHRRHRGPVAAAHHRAAAHGSHLRRTRRGDPGRGRLSSTTLPRAWRNVGGADRVGALGRPACGG